MVSMCPNMALTGRTLYSALMELRSVGQLRRNVLVLMFLTVLVRGMRQRRSQGHHHPWRTAALLT